MTGGAYPGGSEPVIVPSARKHGILDSDILDAFHHPLSRQSGTNDLLMVTGLTSDLVLLEVGYTIVEGRIVIAHAMPARTQFVPTPARRRKRR